MISNYYTLRLLAMDLDRQLKGSEIEEAFCQNKNELLIFITPKIMQDTMNLH